VRIVRANRAAAGDAARSLEETGVNLLFSVGTSLTVPAKAATKEVPIVFAMGVDAAADGLVGSLAKPGGRLTGVQRLSTDLTAKRLDSERYTPEAS
jgi:putative ABC transport system substrate-binding protein